MNAFQSCRNMSDAVPLYLPQNLYLKPIARIHISVQLSQQIQPGKSISNWEIMEKLRGMVKPEEFNILKVSKSTLEFIRFEGEIEDKAKLHNFIALLDGRTMKLSTFTHFVKIRAAEAKQDYPTRHSWDSFFRDAKNMDEMKPGERPDTIHIANLPIRWFVPTHHVEKEGVKPSQKVFHRLFEKFGHIRVVDIPICDPYRSKMKEHMSGMKTFTFDQDTFFEGYVQFKDYVGFTRAMDAFRGMKLLRKDDCSCQTVNLKVDFDKSKHLCDASIRRRQIVRDRLIAKDRDVQEKERNDKEKEDQEEVDKRQHEKTLNEEKEHRRREREEKRKARHFAELKLQETEELKKKIEKEEKKLQKAECKLQAIRLISELFSRIKIKMEKAEARKTNIDQNSPDEISKLKLLRERQVEEQKEKVKNAMAGRVVLSSILGGEAEDDSSNSDSSSDSDRKGKKKHKKSKKKKKKKHKKSSRDHSSPKPEKSLEPNYPPGPENPYPMGDPNWYGYGVPNPMYQFTPIYPPPMRGALPPAFYPFTRGRGINGMAGPSRGSFYPRRRGMFNPNYNRGWRGRRGANQSHYTPELEKEYYKYFQQFLKDGDNDRENRSSSRSSSRSRSYSKSRSRRRSRTRSYSRSRSRRRSKSSKSRSWSRSRSRSRSRRKSRSRSNTRRTKSRSQSRRSRSRTKSRNRSRSSRSKSLSKSKSSKQSSNKKQSNERSRSPSYISIDSSKFISPSRLRANRSQSESWSLPKNNDKNRSWSRSPTPKKSN